MKTPPEDLAAKLYALSEDYLAEAGEFRIDEVAKAVEVPRATLYYYFSGREDLLSFLMAEKAQRVGVAARKALAQGGTTPERLDRLISAMVATLADAPSLCVNMVAAMGRGPAMADLLAAGEQAFFAPLREVLLEGGATGELQVPDPDVAAAGIAGAVLMASLRCYLSDGVIDAEAVSATLSSELVEGLRAR